MSEQTEAPTIATPTPAHPAGWPHCPDCTCLPLDHEVFCWKCGAGVCHDLSDCEDDVRGQFCPEPVGCEPCAGTGAADPRAWATGRTTGTCAECHGHGYSGTGSET